MAKDYAKFVPPKPRAAQRKQRQIEMLLSVFLLIVALVLGGYSLYHKQVQQGVIAEQGFHGVLTRFAALFQHHAKEAKSAKKTVVAAKPDGPQPVHFDFYSQLPSMQVTLPEANPVEVATNNRPASLPPVTKVEAEAPKPQIAKAATPERSTEQSSVLNPAEVTSLLEAEAKPEVMVKTASQQYMLELGSYDSREAAKLFADAISGVGFHAEVSRVSRDGRKMFVVRQGPFNSLEVAKSSQQRLQKRGIQGEIHKSV